MAKAKKHRLIIEMTDMSGERTTKMLRSLVEDALDSVLIHPKNQDIMNVQVKDYNRYEQGIKNSK